MCHACPVELRIGVLGAQNDQCGPCVHPRRTGQAPAEVCVCVRVVKERATGATWPDLPRRPSDPVFPEGVGGEEAGTRVTQAAEREVTLTPLLGPGPLIPAPLQF